MSEDRKPDLSQLQDDDNEPSQREVKPDVKMGIIVEYQGNPLKLQLKPNTNFRKVFEAAAKKFNKDLAALRFTFNGKRLLNDDTPAGVEMEDDDVIDVHLEQLGGGSSRS